MRDHFSNITILYTLPINAISIILLIIIYGVTVVYYIMYRFICYFISYIAMLVNDIII